MPTTQWDVPLGSSTSILTVSGGNLSQRAFGGATDWGAATKVNTRATSDSVVLGTENYTYGSASYEKTVACTAIGGGSNVCLFDCKEQLPVQDLCCKTGSVWFDRVYGSNSNLVWNSASWVLIRDTGVNTMDTSNFYTKTYGWDHTMWPSGYAGSDWIFNQYHVTSYRYYKFDAGTAWDYPHGKEFVFTIFDTRLYYWRYLSSGTVTTTVFDYGALFDSTLTGVTAPTTLGAFHANVTVPVNSSLSFTSSTSSNALDWSTPVTCTLGASIISDPKRYLRIVATLTATTPKPTTGGTGHTPILTSLTVGASFRTAITPFSQAVVKWGTLQATPTLNSQTCTYWIRTGNTEAAVLAAAWVQKTATTGGTQITWTDDPYHIHKYIQLEIRLSTTDYAQIPTTTAPIVNYTPGIDIGATVKPATTAIKLLATDDLTLTPLHIRKDTTTYGLMLVPTTNELASSLRIKTTAASPLAAAKIL